MTNEWKHSERHLTEPQWFWFIAVIGLLTRLPLLTLSSAETTDGILSLTYFSKDFVATPRFIIMPGYPFLLWLGHAFGSDEWLWGRGISCLAGLLFLIPLWRFSRRWMDVEMTAMTCLIALFSPLLWQWSLKVMPDTTFLLFFWWSLERLTTVYIEKRSRAWWEACLTGMAAACVRPEGFILLPWILALEIQVSDGKGWIRKLFVLFLWAVPL
ncbi:MAG TPA: glycosyltransferase family 39 protein, partial [bacterium]|nr:glycosyltransferase family 39 protein [bacterium]